MIRLKAALIWYRSRSGGELTLRLDELLHTIDADVISEKTTIDPKQIRGLLVNALKNADVTVIIGGLDILRDEENIIHILSRCLAIKLEEGSHSRSQFQYDPLRGRPLPTFETAVLYPSQWGGPEGMSMTAGEKTIILLPWMDRQQMDIITMMEKHLPDIMVGIYGKEEEAPVMETVPDPVEELPYYIRQAVAKHQAAAVVPDEDFDPAGLRQRLLLKQGIDAPAETNAPPPPVQQPSRPIQPQPAVQQRIYSGDPWAVNSAEDYVRPKKPPKERPVNRHMPAVTPSGGAVYIFRIAAVSLLLAVIFISCYVAAFHYKSELVDAPEVYQSDLAALFEQTGDNSILPDYALDKFASLYAVNPNVRGFISIPGTSFGQPIVQSPVEDAIAYSQISFRNSADTRGTLYFDQANDISFGAHNSNLVVYGNSPSDGSMFSELHNYTDGKYFSEHQIINMDTLYEKGQWVVFSVCIVSGNTVSEFNYADTVFAGEDAHQQHLYNLYIRSMFCTEIEVFPTDDLLTLVTDSSEFTGAKLLVCARKLRADEEVSSLSHNVIANDLALMPDIWYDLHADVHAPAIPEYNGVTTTSREPITLPDYTDENGNMVYVTVYTAAPENQTTTTAVKRPTSVPDMRITTGGTVITAPAADILAMIAEAEMGSDASLEALKAQCVASYTLYLYSGGSAKAPNFPTTLAGERCRQAADEVIGQYMTYNTNVPYTPYFAVSAGKTADNEDINGSKLAYLPSVDSSVDESLPGITTVTRVSAAEVSNKVLTKKGIDLTETPDKSLWFQILERDANDLYVSKISVGGTVVRGNSLYMSILGGGCLSSPCFWIEYDASTDEFVFTCRGSGSGVGMSQSAANEYAKQGYDYLWILKHFYPGVGFTAK